jgi:hypothetical protein
MNLEHGNESMEAPADNQMAVRPQQIASHECPYCMIVVPIAVGVAAGSLIPICAHLTRSILDLFS